MEKLPTPPQQPNIDLKNTTAIVCEECSNDTFREVMMLRSVSALLSPNGQESIIPLQGLLACDKCGFVPSKFRPKL